MITIELKDVRIQAHHGLYKGESKTGNIYHIDLCVTFKEGNTGFDKLSDTIDYVELYEIVKQRMQEPAHLLEKLCDEMIERIRLKYPFITEASISMYKIHPPIENFEGKVGVTLYKIFDV
ncbi:MAG: dihydroneopterin aldolase [Chitinophagaceae bacterium]|nr:dihydroneopterin aldolase [Chitinophagaceae bacterium]